MYQMAKSVVIRAGQNRCAVIKIFRSLQPHADDGNIFFLEKKVQFFGEGYGRVQGQGFVFFLFVQFCQGASGQHHRGVNPDKIRMHGGNPAAAIKGGRFAVSRQADHHLQSDFILESLQQLNRFFCVGCGVAASGSGQHAVIHGLNAQFNGFNRVRFEGVEPFVVNGVRPRRETDAGDRSRLNK